MIISIIGGSGSGKDTQAQFISKEFGIEHLSMGNILREEKRKGNPKAIEAMEIANQGNWVPDEITSGILLDYLKRTGTHSFVIAGYPRPVEQIKSFDKIVAELGSELLAVVHIVVPDDEMIRRMKRRDEEEIFKGDKREDNNDEVMRKRIQSYKDTIGPLVEEYGRRGILIEVDGTPSREDVKRAIFTQLNARREEGQQLTSSSQ